MGFSERCSVLEQQTSCIYTEMCGVGPHVRLIQDAGLQQHLSVFLCWLLS